MKVRARRNPRSQRQKELRKQLILPPHFGSDIHIAQRREAVRPHHNRLTELRFKVTRSILYNTDVIVWVSPKSEPEKKTGCRSVWEVITRNRSKEAGRGGREEENKRCHLDLVTIVGTEDTILPEAPCNHTECTSEMCPQNGCPGPFCTPPCRSLPPEV